MSTSGAGAVRTTAVALAAVAMLLTAAPAQAQSTYWVVAHASGPWGLGPRIETRVTPPLPAGVRLEGEVRCRRVYNAVGGSVIPDGASLDAGVYQFVKSSCVSDDNNPLRLVGSSANLIINAGTWIVDPAPTGTEAAVVADLDPDDPVVAFSAHVFNAVADGVRLRGRTITFRYERADGFWELEACTGVTADDFQAVASCTLTGEPARRFVAGTGNWEAHFAGERNHNGSSAVGRIAGTQTDPTTAAFRIQQHLNDPANQVTMEKVLLPPQCHNYVDETTTSIIGVSISQMNCSQLKVLQILSEVGIGVALAGAGGGSLVANAAEKIAFASVKQGVKASAKTAAKRVVAGFAVIG